MISWDARMSARAETFIQVECLLLQISADGKMCGVTSWLINNCQGHYWRFCIFTREWIDGVMVLKSMDFYYKGPVELHLFLFNHTVKSTTTTKNNNYPHLSKLYAEQRNSLRPTSTPINSKLDQKCQAIHFIMTSPNPVIEPPEFSAPETTKEHQTPLEDHSK